jgi:hypothetical protein
LATVPAFELVTEKIDHLHTSLAVLVFVDLTADSIVDLFGYDLRIHILKHLVAMTVDTRILLVLQDVVNRISCEGLATVQDASGRQISDDVLYIHTERVLLEYIADNLGGFLVDHHLLVFDLVAVD